MPYAGRQEITIQSAQRQFSYKWFRRLFSCKNSIHSRLCTFLLISGPQILYHAYISQFETKGNKENLSFFVIQSKAKHISILIQLEEEKHKIVDSIDLNTIFMIIKHCSNAHFVIIIHNRSSKRVDVREKWTPIRQVSFASKLCVFYGESKGTIQHNAQYKFSSIHNV